MKVKLIIVAAIALVAIMAVGAQATTLQSEQPPKKVPVRAKQTQHMRVCAGTVHTAMYCAVNWHRTQISAVRDELQTTRERKLMKPLKLEPVGYSLPGLKQSLKWHKKLLRQAVHAPRPSLFQQAAYYAVNVLHYPAREWQCLAKIPEVEGGWTDVGVQFGHRHLTLRRALRYPFGPWQANPGQKIVRYGNPLDIRAQVRWVIAYAKKYHGGCGSLSFRSTHNYW